MAFMRNLKSYTMKGVVGEGGKGGFVSSPSPFREGATYSDFRTTEGPVPVNKDNVRDHILSKDDLWKLIQDPDSGYTARIQQPKETDIVYDHVEFDLSTYESVEDQKKAHKIIGDCLRYPDFEWVKNAGGDRFQTKRIYGDRAVLDMGIHRNTNYPHAQFLVATNTVNKDKTISAAFSLSDRTFAGNQLTEINKKLVEAKLAPLETSVKENPMFAKDAANQAIRRPKSDTMEATAAILNNEPQAVEGEEQAENTVEAVVQQFSEKRRQESTTSMDEGLLHRGVVEQQFEYTKALMASKLEEISLLKAQADAYGKALQYIEENAQLKADLQAAKKDITDLMGNYEELFNEKESILAEKEKVTTDLQQQIEQNNAAHEAALAAQRDQYEGRIMEIQAEMGAEISNLKDTVVEKEQEIDGLSKDVEHISDERDEVLKKFDKLDEEFKTAVFDFDSKMRDAEEKLRTSGQELAAVSAVKEDVTKQLAKAEDKNEDLAEKVEKLHEELEQERSTRAKIEGKFEAVAENFDKYRAQVDTQFKDLTERFEKQLAETVSTKNGEMERLRSAYEAQFQSKLDELAQRAAQNVEDRVTERTAQLESAAKEMASRLDAKEPNASTEIRQRYGLDRVRNTEASGKPEAFLRTTAEQDRERKAREEMQKRGEDPTDPESPKQPGNDDDDPTKPKRR